MNWKDMIRAALTALGLVPQGFTGPLTITINFNQGRVTDMTPLLKGERFK